MVNIDNQGFSQAPKEGVYDYTQTFETPTEPKVTATEELITGPGAVIPPSVTPIPEVEVPVTPIVEEVKVEAPVIPVEEPAVITEPTKIEEVKEIPKITDAQTVKANELANKEAERLIKEQEDKKHLTTFSTAINSGATADELTEIMNKQPGLKDQYKTLARDKFKTSSNGSYFAKYSNLSNEELMTASKNGEVVIGSEQYNLLPEVQRKSFEIYKKQEDAVGIVGDNKEQFANDNKNIISFSDILAEQKKIFSTNIREQYNAAINTKEITDTAKDLETKQNEINSLNDTISDISDDVRNQYPNLPASAQAVLISDRTRKLTRDKNTLINEYNSKLGTYTSLKNNAKIELELLQLEDKQAKDIYDNALDIYTTRIESLTEVEKTKFEAQNKEIAANLKFQRDLALKEFDAKLKKEAQGGVYKTARDGSMIYVKNGVSTPVTDAEGEIMFTETKKDFKDTTTKLENGTILTTRSYDDGRKPEYFTYDVRGNMANGGTMAVNDLVSNIKSDDLQCGAAVNKYVVGQLGISSKDFWMGDSYKSKARYINSDIPKIGGVAIWNDTNLADGKYAENGHTGIVTGYNKTTGEVEITDWNWNGDKRKSVHNVKITDITGSDGGFYISDKIPTFDIADISVFNSLTASEKAKRQNEPQFKDIVKSQNKVFTDPNANPFDVIRFSKGGKDMSTTDNKEIRKFSAVLNSLGEIQETITDATGGIFGTGTGPIQGLLRSKDPYDVTAQKLKAQITSLIPNLARGVYGEVGVLTEADVDLYRRTVPNLTQTEDVNRALLGMTLRLVKRGLETSLTDLARAGTDTSGFEGKLKSINTELEVLERDLMDKPTIKAPTVGKGSLRDITKQTIDTSDYNSLLNK